MCANKSLSKNIDDNINELVNKFKECPDVINKKLILKTS